MSLYPYTNKTQLQTQQNLESLDLKQELLDQYNTALKMQEDAQIDPYTPLNQKAQLVNAITGILATITKQRTDIYNSERLRKIEEILIQTLKKYPNLYEDFMQEYERTLCSENI